MGVLRQVFGPSKEEIWSQLSREIGAEYQEGGFFKEGKIVLSHREWEITLDTYTVHTGKVTIIYTRMRAPYVNRDGFRFNIYRKSAFSWLGKLFGVEDIEVGEAFFDEEFIIQGEPEILVRSMLNNSRIRQLIQDQKDIHFQVKDDDGWFKSRFPEGVDELSMADWISTLGDLPQAAIDGAVQDRMRNETRRPTPAHIRQLAKARIEAPKPPPPDDDDMPFRPVVTDPAELERRREKAQKIMAEVASKLRRTEK